MLWWETIIWLGFDLLSVLNNSAFVSSPVTSQLSRRSAESLTWNTFEWIHLDFFFFMFLFVTTYQQSLLIIFIAFIHYYFLRNMVKAGIRFAAYSVHWKVDHSFRVFAFSFFNEISLTFFWSIMDIFSFLVSLVFRNRTMLENEQSQNWESFFGAVEGNNLFFHS